MYTYTENSRAKAIEACRTSLGCDWPMQSIEVKKKAAHTLQERYGVDNYAKIRYITDVDVQAELQDAEIFNNTALITAKESNLVDSRYYTSLCKHLEERSIGYVVAFPWDNLNKIRNQLNPKKDIFAESCQLYRITADYANEFLCNYDYRPIPRGQLLCLGHVLDGQLIQVMTFGKVRNPGEYHIRLIRAVTHPDFAVIGGYNALSNSASVEFGVHKVCVTCDKAKPAFNRLYPLLGMQLLGYQQTARHLIHGQSMYDCGYTLFGT